jgi:hypothetical protein
MAEEHGGDSDRSRDGSESSATAESGTNAADGNVSEGADERSPDVPEEVVSEAERLTRLADEAAKGAAAEAYRERRAELVTDHDYTARVREEDDTLILYPDEWVDDGTVQFDRIEETDRAVEVSLSGPDQSAEWEAVEARNEAIIEAVEEAYGPAHAANVRAFADFMGNHYLKSVADATADEREEFLTEYYPRNVWPSAEQESIVAESVDVVADVADDVPGT